MSAVFVINPGGTSKKYALFISGTAELEAIFERTDNDFQVCTRDSQKNEEIKTITKDEYDNALSEFAAAANSHARGKGITIDAIGIRILAAGTEFQNHQKIDDVFVSKLQAKEPTAPLHIPVTLEEIRQCRLLMPGVPLVAASDTAFFANLPAIAREYSVARNDAKEYDLHRFGYHGLSVASVIDRVHAVTGAEHERMIVCHIGSGISVTGVRTGQPMYTSAGYASFTSLPMLTRGGDIDAGVVLELLRLHHGKYTEVNKYLHFDCGAKALAGVDDVRILLDRKTQGDSDAAFALDLLSFSIQKAIAAATVATGGVDAIIFTGTIGSRSPDLRRLILSRLSYLGCTLDEDKNNLFLSREGIINQSRSLVKIATMRTDEMGQIAHIAAHRIEAKQK